MRRLYLRWRLHRWRLALMRSEAVIVAKTQCFGADSVHYDYRLEVVQAKAEIEWLERALAIPLPNVTVLKGGQS